jgi:hypothetical protein
MAAIGRSNYKQVLKKVERDTPLRLSQALQATAIEGINRLVDRTPVDTGAAKFHWFVRPLPDERFDKERTDPSGAQPKSRAKRDVKLFRIGQTVWLVNSAPYFVYLEHGSSKQAPNGIVAITLAEMQLLWQKAVQVAFSRDPKSS